MKKVLEEPSLEEGLERVKVEALPRTYALIGLTNDTTTWAANFHMKFPKKPNKRLRNFCEPII